MAAWVKLGAVGESQILINVDNKVLDVIYGFELVVWDTGTLFASFGDGQPSYSARYKWGSTALELNQWYHVAVVIRGAEDISLYLNGQDDGGVYGGAGGVIAYSGGSSQIGCRNGPDLFFNGCIDDAVLFDVALTPDQIYRLYKLSGQSFAGPCGNMMLPADAKLPGDVNKDCRVDLRDYVWLALEWLKDTPPLLADVYSDQNHRVDHSDLEMLTSHWLEEADLSLRGHWEFDGGSGSEAGSRAPRGGDARGGSPSPGR